MTNKPEMKAVNSSMVAAIGYDDVHEALWVEFNGGKFYTYAGVRVDVWNELLHEAESGGSAGKFINAKIKPNYAASKVEG